MKRDLGKSKKEGIGNVMAENPTSSSQAERERRAQDMRLHRI